MPKPKRPSVSPKAAYEKVLSNTQMVVTSGSNEFEPNELQIQADGGEAMLADYDMAAERADENANNAQTDASKSASNDSPSGAAKARMAISPTSRMSQVGQKHGSSKNSRNSMSFSSNGDSETDFMHVATTQAIRKRKCDVLMTVVAASSLNARYSTPTTAEHVATATRHSMMSDDSETSLSSSFSSPLSDCGHDLVSTEEHERAAKKRKLALRDHPAAHLHANVSEVPYRAKPSTSKLKRSPMATHVELPTSSGSLTSAYTSATFSELRAKTAVNSCMNMEVNTRSAVDSATFENCALQLMMQVVDEKMTRARADNSSLSMQNLIDGIEKCLGSSLTEASRERIRQVASMWLEQHPEQADM